MTVLTMKNYELMNIRNKINALISQRID